MSDYEIGEMEEDGALDVRDEILEALKRGIDQMLDEEGFCSVDVSAIRAKIAILTTIVKYHGGIRNLDRAEVERWGTAIDRVFTDERLWGFTPWPDDVKAQWRTGCRTTVNSLLDQMKNHE